ncbi:hypothetical protein [Enhydrobacter aerosaccus]|uniref:hypothetical protein n=1 Tax=Enhydrobacter aerosaccus TaxID=225324 RepID=UPI000A2EE502|nr:hypothetical protein [Enhydrobacter aerosaccus]
MDKLLSFLPSWVPLAAIGILLVVLAGGAWALKTSWQNEALASAQLEQFKKDAALSAKALETRDARIKQVEAEAATAKQRIANAPITATCGPVVRDAADSVRHLLGGKTP